MSIKIVCLIVSFNLLLNISLFLRLIVDGPEISYLFDVCHSSLVLHRIISINFIKKKVFTNNLDPITVISFDVNRSKQEKKKETTHI